MLLDLLAFLSLPNDIIARTRSTAAVQHVVQLSLAPAFLLAGIGAIMNVMTNRLIWVADRIERIHIECDAGKTPLSVNDLPFLQKRRIYAQRAVMFSTASALSISVVISLIFLSPYVSIQLGTATALVWLLTMVLLATGLLFFLMETRTAAMANRERIRVRKAADARKAMEAKAAAQAIHNG